VLLRARLKSSSSLSVTNTTLLIIRERQIKITMRYHFKPVIMANIKKTKNSNVGQVMKKRYTTTRSHISSAILENSVESLKKN
jgi:hypothetical protein